MMRQRKLNKLEKARQLGLCVGRQQIRVGQQQRSSGRAPGTAGGTDHAANRALQ